MAMRGAIISAVLPGGLSAPGRARRLSGARAVTCALLSAVLTLPALAETATAGGVPLPSGREVTFHDVVWGAPGPAGLTVRFRFLDPRLARARDTLPYVLLEADMAFLCETYALDRIANTGPQPAQIVISISEVPVDFGAPDTGVAQVFEAYRAEDGACIWEGF